MNLNQHLLPIYHRIESTALSHWVNHESPWLWPMMETIHFFGLDTAGRKSVVSVERRPAE